MTAIQQIPIQSIATPPWNARTADEELVESVKLHGILSPICLLATGPKEFRVVYGSRRLDAASKAGLATVPAIVREDLPEAEQRILAIIENVQRCDNDPIQEGKLFKELIGLGVGVGEISKRICKHPNYIRQRIKLAGLAPAILKQLADTDYTPAAAALLSLLPTEDAGAVVESRPYLLSDADELRAYIAESSPSLASAPFSTEDATLTPAPACAACPKRMENSCLARTCYAKKVAAFVGREVARIRADGLRDAPLVASEEPLDEIGGDIFKRLGVEILKRERIAGDDESGGRHAILLDDLRPRLVRLVPSNRPKDGRARRHGDPHRQAQVRASFIARAAGELLAQRLDAPDAAPIPSDRFLISLASAATGEEVPDLAAAQREVLRLLAFRLRQRLMLSESISAIEPDALRDTAQNVIACISDNPDATLARLDEQAETALKA